MGLLAWRQFAPGCSARIEQFFPPHLPGPVLQALQFNTARLVIMKIVRDPVRIQPSKRLFHGVALFDAVERWHGASKPLLKERERCSRMRHGLLPVCFTT